MAKLEIVKDSEGNKIVLIPEILFFNKQNIEWELVEQYLEKYVGEIVEIARISVHRIKYSTESLWTGSALCIQENPKVPEPKQKLMRHRG